MDLSQAAAKAGDVRDRSRRGDSAPVRFVGEDPEARRGGAGDRARSRREDRSISLEGHGPFKVSHCARRGAGPFNSEQGSSCDEVAGGALPGMTSRMLARASSMSRLGEPPRGDQSQLRILVACRGPAGNVHGSRSQPPAFLRALFQAHLARACFDATGVTRGSTTKKIHLAKIFSPSLPFESARA